MDLVRPAFGVDHHCGLCGMRFYTDGARLTAWRVSAGLMCRPARPRFKLARGPRIGDMRVIRHFYFGRTGRVLWALNVWRSCDCPECVADGHWFPEGTAHTRREIDWFMKRWNGRLISDEGVWHDDR